MRLLVDEALTKDFGRLVELYRPGQQRTKPRSLARQTAHSGPVTRAEVVQDAAPAP